MSARAFHPCPGYRDGSSVKSQRNHQPLMSKTNVRGIKNQANFTGRFGRDFQPMSCDRLIPLAYMDGWIIQKPLNLRVMLTKVALPGIFIATLLK